MSSDTLQIEILEEVLNASLNDSEFKISIDGSGGGIASVEELNRFAYTSAFAHFRLSQLMNSSFFQMEDGFMDWLDDESYIDLANCVNQNYVNWFSTVFYYTPDLLAFVPQNMVLESISVDSNGVSDAARFIALIEEVDAITLNTDLKVSVSRDGGITWTEGVLEVEGNLNNNFKVVVCDVTLNSQPEDLHLRYKIETLNNKAVKIFSTALSWL